MTTALTRSATHNDTTYALKYDASTAGNQHAHFCSGGVSSHNSMSMVKDLPSEHAKTIHRCTRRCVRGRWSTPPCAKPSISISSQKQRTVIIGNIQHFFCLIKNKISQHSQRYLGNMVAKAPSVPAPASPQLSLSPPAASGPSPSSSPNSRAAVCMDGSILPDTPPMNMSYMEGKTLFVAVRR